MMQALTSQLEDALTTITAQKERIQSLQLHYNKSVIWKAHSPEGKCGKMSPSLVVKSAAPLKVNMLQKVSGNCPKIKQ